jgi:DeoR/GlpR family transcriptional regulator of sugar metabolism
MLTEQRKQLLMERLKADGRLVAKDIAGELDLSEDTIRRDLRELAAEGKLTRVHGGALPASPTVANLAARRAMATDEKARLAQAGAKLITRGMTLFLDGGTTNLEVVRHLPLDLEATVITHSPTIAAALEPHERIRVIVIGGLLFRHSMVSVGAAAIEAISRIRADLFFLGITGLHPTEGLTTGDYEESLVKSAIMARAAETVSLVTAEKIGAVSPYQVCGLAAVSMLVVGRQAKMPEVAKGGPKIIRA